MGKRSEGGRRMGKQGQKRGPSAPEGQSLAEYVERLVLADRELIWHPFTQMKDWAGEDPIIISEGRGCFLKDIRGRWYLDGVSSLWVNLHGHRKKEIDEALKAQVDRIAHSTLLGAANVPSIELAQRLVGLMDGSFGKGRLRRVFYSDNGSTAVEAALKMAFQYWKHKGVEGRNAFIALEHAYHGDTLGAVSVGGVEMFHQAFGPLLFKTFRAPAPYCYRCTEPCAGPCASLEAARCLRLLEETLSEHASEIAALIIEPLVQAAGGIIVSPPGYLARVRELCTRYGVLMIADEVATGFGRTGKMFACEHENVVPDIICLSKGITGGYLPLAVTVASDEVYGAFLGEFREVKTFFHGHSYTGNPLGCACALACLDVFEKENTLGALVPKVRILRDWLDEVRATPGVGDVRSSGLIAGVELVRDKATGEPWPFEQKRGWQVAYAAREEGVLIRPLGNVVVIMPPLAIAEEDLKRMLEVIGRGVRDATA